MIAQCTFCARKIDNDDVGVYQKVTAWERNRKEGGTNAIRLPHRHAEWACHACIESRVRGLQHQPPLF